MATAWRRAREILYRRADGMLSGFRPGAEWMSPIPQTRIPLTALVLLLIGSSGIAAAWILFSFASGQQSSWIAVIAALDAAFLLRLGRMPGSWIRSLCGVIGTALAIAMANWGIVAAQLGKEMGLLPWESIFRLGPHFTWTLTILVNDRVDLAWWGAALVVGAIASR
jgi:hypothetical protein